MSLLTVELPKSLYMKISELSEIEGISANQFLVLAAAEKMSAILTENYLEEESRKGRHEDFEKVMKAVPSAKPDLHDRIRQIKRQIKKRTSQTFTETR